jgi:glucose-6-phosphate-specific signal transduction histidine kinase
MTAESPGRKTIKGLEKQCAELEQARALAVQALGAAVQERDMNRDLALQFETELLTERQSVAQQLNEGLAPAVTTIRALASTITHRLGASDASLAQMAAMICSSADALLDQIRQMRSQLQVDAAESSGLIAAVRALLDDWRLREPQRRIELLISPDEEAFGLGASDTEALALRLIREGLERLHVLCPHGLFLVSLSVQSSMLGVQLSTENPVERLQAQLGPWTDQVEPLVSALRGSCDVAFGQDGGSEILIRLPWSTAPV